MRIVYNGNFEEECKGAIIEYDDDYIRFFPSVLKKYYEKLFDK